MKFSQDAFLNAAAAIVAARIQSRAASGAKADDDVSRMLLVAMTEVLGGIELMEEHAKSESFDLWERLVAE